MNHETFDDMRQRLRQLGPFANDEAAGDTLLAVLGAMSHGLLSQEREVLASSLPPEAAGVLADHEPMRACTLEGLVEDVARQEGISPGLAIEQVEVVGRVLLETLPPLAHALLTRAFPFLSRLLEQRQPLDPLLPVSEWSSGAPHDLAEGREGARHPLASSDPRRLAHRHSIARSDDPHGDSKLSGARGLSQEREQETLASGRPGSKRPLSSSH